MDVAATSKLPNPLCLSGNIYQNWLKFKGELDDYLISIEFDEKSDKVKTAKLRNLIGDEGRQVIADLALNKSFEYDDLIAKLDVWAESHRNIAKCRSQFFCCEQDENENFEHFLSNARTLIQRCNFGNLAEELLRDKITTGIFNPQLKELFDSTPDISLESAIQMCRVIDLSEDQLLKLLVLKQRGKVSDDGLESRDHVNESVTSDVNGDSLNGVAADKDSATPSNESTAKDHKPVSQVEETRGCLPSDDISGSIPFVPKELNLKGNDANFARRINDNEATIRMTLEKFSKHGGVRLSPPFYFRNLFWRLKVKWNQTTDTEDSQLSCFLMCDGGPSNQLWKCTATSTHKVLSQREGIKHSSETSSLPRLFDPKSSSWGYREFIKKNTLLNPDNGFIKDDKIILEVTFAVID